MNGSMPNLCSANVSKAYETASTSVPATRVGWGRKQRNLIVGFRSKPAITIRGTDVMGKARRMAPPGHDACCSPRSDQSTERLANASEDEEEATDTAHLTGSADKVRDLGRAPRRLHRLPSSDTDDGPRQSGRRRHRSGFV